MSGIINKVKAEVNEILHPNQHHTGVTGTTGTHNGAVGTTGNHTTHTGALGTTGTTHGTTTAGPHDSNIANKLDPRVDSTTGANTVGTGAGYGSTTGTGYGTSTTGPHTSNVANTVDPRVHSTGVTGGTTGTGYNTTHGTTGAGPHTSNLANKLDPRVDSTTGANTVGTGSNYSSNTTGAGYDSTGYDTHNTTTTAGPHSSNLANKLDPRVDASGSTGATGTHLGNHSGSHHTGDVGGVSHSTNAGPHDSNFANKLDPRVDSTLTSTGNRHGATTGGVIGAPGSHATAGSGTAQNTAGPHNSDLLNKLDPRVDSDRDGSGTIGGNRTHA